MVSLFWIQGNCIRDRLHGVVMGDFPPCCFLGNMRSGRVLFPVRRDDTEHEGSELEAQSSNITFRTFRLILPFDEERIREREQPGLVFRVDRTKKSVSDSSSRNTLETRSTWQPIVGTISQYSTPAGITRHHVYFPEATSHRRLRSKIPPKWEHILRKAVFQSMRRNGGIHRGQLHVSLQDVTDKLLWERLNEARFVSPVKEADSSSEETSKADSRISSVPQDISTVAKGVLVRKGDGFEFRILDTSKRKNFLTNISTAASSYSNCVCGVPSPHDGFVAIWSIRKIRHSGPGFGFPRFELHFSVLPASNPLQNLQDSPEPFFPSHPSTPSLLPPHPPSFEEFGQPPAPPSGFHEPSPGHLYKGVPVYDGPEYDPRFLAIYRDVVETYLRKKRPPPPQNNQLVGALVDPSSGPPPTFFPTNRPIFYSDVVPPRQQNFRPSTRYHHFSELDPLFHPRRPSITYVTLMPYESPSPREKPSALSLTSPATERSHGYQVSPTPSIKSTTNKTPTSSAYPNSINEQLPPSDGDDDTNIPYVAAAMPAAKASPDVHNRSLYTTELYHGSQYNHSGYSDHNSHPGPDISIPLSVTEGKILKVNVTYSSPTTVPTSTHYISSYSTSHYPTTRFTTPPVTTSFTTYDNPAITTFSNSDTYTAQPSYTNNNTTRPPPTFSYYIEDRFGTTVTAESSLDPVTATTEQVTIQYPTTGYSTGATSTATSKLDQITMALVNHARTHNILRTETTTEYTHETTVPA